MSNDDKRNRILDAVVNSMQLQGIKVETYGALNAIVDKLQACGIDPDKIKPSEFDSQVAEVTHPSHFTNTQTKSQPVPKVDYEQAALDAKFAADMKQFEIDDAAYKTRCETVKAVGGIMPFAPVKPVRQVKRETTQEKLARGNREWDKKREAGS